MQTFYGPVVSSVVVNGWPFDRIDVSDREVVFHRAFRREVTASLQAVRAVKVERLRAFPLVWRTYVRFDLRDHDEPIGIIPFRGKALVATLRSLGWPVAP